MRTADQKTPSDSLQHTSQVKSSRVGTRLIYALPFSRTIQLPSDRPRLKALEELFSTWLTPEHLLCAWNL
jgi:hypothetical protein